MERGRFSPAIGTQKTDLSQMARQMGEDGDLLGLATVAEASLTALRQLCERPEDCSDLDEMLATLRDLKSQYWATMGE